jgi:hypothetical protein
MESLATSIAHANAAATMGPYIVGAVIMSRLEFAAKRKGWAWFWIGLAVVFFIAQLAQS